MAHFWIIALLSKLSYATVTDIFCNTTKFYTFNNSGSDAVPRLSVENASFLSVTVKQVASIQA